MVGRRRVAAGDTTSSKYRGSDGRWHARVTMGTRLDGRPERKHLSRATKSELDRPSALWSGPVTPASTPGPRQIPPCRSGSSTGCRRSCR